MYVVWYVFVGIDVLHIGSSMMSKDVLRKVTRKVNYSFQAKVDTSTMSAD